MARTKTRIKFEGIPDDPGRITDPVPDGYAGLDWTNFDAYRRGSRSEPGYENLVVGDTAGFNGGGNLAGFAAIGVDDTFTFKRGIFASAFVEDLAVTIRGFRDGLEVARWDGTFGTSPTTVRFGATFRDVDEVRFETLGDLPGLGLVGLQLPMDNLVLVSDGIL